MSEILPANETRSLIWGATLALRWVERSPLQGRARERVLQQRWQDLVFGTHEWRDVPLEAA